MMVLARKEPNSQPSELQLDAAGNLKIKAVPGDSTLAVQIANGQSLSAAIDLGTARLAYITMPAAWDAADITFQASPDGQVPHSDLYDSTGAEYTVKAAAGRTILINLADLMGVRFLKIRSGKSGAVVNQTALRALTLGLAQ